MSAHAVAKHYGNLTPEERFRLILAASGRGDEAERDRLVTAGGRLTLSMQDHAPYAHAFAELALLVYIELLEEAARYLDALARADEPGDMFGDDAEDEGGREAEAVEEPGDNQGESAERADADPAEEDACERPLWQRTLDLALAAGFVLRTKAEGWKRFCERRNVPTFLYWEGFPGFDRLQRALALAEHAAFVPEGMLRWLNAIRPAGKPELAEVPLTAEGVAAATEEMFQKRVDWWGG